VEDAVIVDLPSTTTAAVSKKLVRLRNDVGAMALGRVLTLLIVADESDADEAIEAANDASRQHPCRIIAIVTGNKRGASRLDAQIRVGGDAGASEVVVLRLYGALADHGDSVITPLLLPDSPVVAWWPRGAPGDVSADAIGAMAQRRITDAAEARNPHKEMQRRAATYTPGDTDLAWTRITLWRGLLAAALDQPPYEPVVSATVTGGGDSPSTDLLAAWLAQTLKCPVTRARTRAGTGMVSVRLERRGGDIDLVRPDGVVATLVQPGQPVRRISLSRRQLAECLADELRRLDPDEIYAETLTKGLAKVGRSSLTATEAIAEGEAPSIDEARKESRRAARKNHSQGSNVMVSASSPPEQASDEAVKQAASSKLEAHKSATPAAATSRRSTRVTATAAPSAGKGPATKAAAKKGPAATKTAAAKKGPAPKAAGRKASATKAPAAKASAGKDAAARSGATRSATPRTPAKKAGAVGGGAPTTPRTTRKAAAAPPAGS
jgi:glucose-6-phosphate dehydrogenase assembly protein OpcA